MTIDASRALRRLGITHDVNFRAMRLPRGWLAGVDPTDPATVEYDPDQLRIWSYETGEDPRKALAHELVHVRQMANYASPIERAIAYESELRARGYEGNRFEVQANALAPHLAPDITLT